MNDSYIEGKPIPVSDYRVDGYKRRSQLCEILSVIAITAGFALVIHGFFVAPTNLKEGIAGLIFIGLAGALFIVAVRYATIIETEGYRLAQDSYYLISSYRIGTLREVKAPEDVTKFLESIEDDFNPLSQSELLSRLRRALGAERTSEIKDIVLKYTRVDADAN